MVNYANWLALRPGLKPNYQKSKRLLGLGGIRKHMTADHCPSPANSSTKAPLGAWQAGVEVPSMAMEAESSGQALPRYAFLMGSCTSWQALGDNHSACWGCLLGCCGCPGGTCCLMTLFLRWGRGPPLPLSSVSARGCWFCPCGLQELIR